jgi:hypothetical protein
MLQSDVKLTGKLVIKKFDDANKLVYETEVKNLVVTSGKQFIASRIVGSTGAIPVMGFMAIGDDASTASTIQTTLVNELARVAVDSATASGVNSTFVATFPAGTGTGNIVEASITNTSGASVISFDGDTAVDDGGDTITYVAHGFVTGDLVTYTDGGNTSITNLTDGAQYYIIKSTNDVVKLATSSANAIAGTAINITGTSGAGHKLSKGTMLCRTTFPVIAKSAGETLAISWVITVG